MYGEDAYLNFAGSHAMSTGFVEWSLEDGRTVLEPNLSPLAFEPMIVILDFGTIVIESMVAITEKGIEVLTPLELDWM
jgi:Xaa-Pro aminopeptidase